jgi:hypothetical protein
LPSNSPGCDQAGAITIRTPSVAQEDKLATPPSEHWKLERLWRVTHHTDWVTKVIPNVATAPSLNGAGGRVRCIIS